MNRHLLPPSNERTRKGPHTPKRKRELTNECFDDTHQTILLSSTIPFGIIQPKVLFNHRCYLRVYYLSDVWGAEGRTVLTDFGLHLWSEEFEIDENTKD